MSDPAPALAPAAALRAALETVEETYEFMIAYAAQGRRSEAGDEGISRIRQYVTRLDEALGTMAGLSRAAIAHPGGVAFRARFEGDVEVARSILALLLARPSITSEMVDNTNALIPLRALLTELFFIDQVVLPPR